MSKAPVLGIDLGTTNSVVAVADDGKSRILRTTEEQALMPSIVSFHPSGDVLVGADAKDRRLLDAENTIYSVKRLIGRPHNSYEVQQAQKRFAFELKQGPTGGVLVAARGETYTLSEISAFVLRHVRQTAEASVGMRSGQAVITVPANFNELQRSATKAAGRVAGLEVLRILNEPTAAALAYGYGKTTNERVAVYDFGGGTFDVTILQLAGDVFEVLATAGDTFLGGDDVDIAVADDMAMRFLEQTRYDVREDRQAYERLRAAAEWAKCQLSKKNKIKLCMEELAYGERGVGLDLDYQLSRAQLENMCRPLLTRTFDVCEDAMRVAGIRPTQLDNVILVGGSTRIPLLQSMVAEYFGRKPLVTIDPDLVVAQGAALQAAALSQTTPRTELARLALKKVPREEAVREHLDFTGLDDESDPLADLPTQIGPVEQHIEPRADGFEDMSTEVATLDNLLLELPEPDIEHPQPPPPPRPPPPPPVATELSAPEPSADEPELTLELPSIRPPSELDTSAAPLLLDVTPLSLGVETVDGYCEHIIGRNAAIPAEETKMFATARDGQQMVAVRICQGESRRLEENQQLGEVVLDGLRDAPRGDVQIAVTFYIDPDGTLNVRAKDMGTGLEQSIAIKLIGELPDEDVEALRAKHEQKFGG